MHVDLLTLYLLAIGTLLAGACMTLWEQRANPRRARALGKLAAGFATLAVGCAAVLVRRDLPGAWGSALSNLIILGGYLLILNGVAALRGRTYPGQSIAVLAGMALVWAVWGPDWQDAVWSYVSAAPIAAVSAMTAWQMQRCEPLRPLPSRRIVVALTAAHGMVYLLRATVLPWLVGAYGPAIHAMAGKITIYEGVLYSVLLPMALLRLIREETHEQLLRDSQTDYLTRLGNRRWFFEEGARIVERSRASAAVAVLAFDLDQFKAINDRYGHQTGDEVLKAFAEVARGVLGPDAVLARVGGEEFAAVLSGDDARRAEALGQTIARRFAQSIPNRIESAGIPATVSIGLARFDRNAPTLSEGLAAADRALYRAKALGGNRLELAEDLAGVSPA